MAATNVLGLLLLLIVHPATSESYCPAIALGDRSTLDPVGTKGFPVTFYQIFYTEGFAHKLNISWVRHPGNLSLSRNYSKNVEFQDKHTVNASLIIYDAQPFPAEGTYTVTASSNCTSNGTQFYLQMYSCNVSAVPQPLEAHNMTVIPETALPDELHLRVPFHGSPDTGWSNTNWMYENKDFCTENSFSPNPRIDCNRTRISPQANCTFTADLWISKPDYTNSGPYTVNAISTFAQPPSNNSTIDLHIVPQPRIGNCTTGHKTISTGSHFHLECQITAYSDFVNVTVVKNDRKLLNYSARDICWHHEPDKTVATCAVDIQVSGNSRFKLCVGYNNTVPHRSLPLCSEDMHVTLEDKTAVVPIVVGSVIGFIAMVVVGMLLILGIIVVYLYKKKKEVHSSYEEQSNRNCQNEVSGEHASLLSEEKDGVRRKPLANQHVQSYGTMSPEGSHALLSLLDPKDTQTDGLSTVHRHCPLPVTGTRLYPSVTVVYAHNPHLYKQIEQPTVENEATKAQYEKEVVENEERMEQDIDTQKALVKEFVELLMSWGIPVAYDQQIKDRPINNRRLWIEDKIKNSDYVIFIITPSFVPFVKSSDTPEDEMIFQGPYLHNLISNPGKNTNGKDIVLVSVFLNRPRDCEQLPKALETGNIYQLWTPFEGEERCKDDLNSLNNLIMGN